MNQSPDEAPMSDNPSAIGWGAIDQVHQQMILDHYRNPRNHRTLPVPDVQATEVNPFCGDEATFQARVSDGVLAEVGIHGVGCSISQASLSMMSEAVLHLTPAGASELSSIFQRLMQGQPVDADETARLGDLAGLASVRKYPIRVKCALLAWLALDQGLHDHLAGA